MLNGSIYLLTNTVNGKKYVGQTICKPDRRWYFHIYAALKGGSSPLCRAIRKYGCEKFTAEIIHTCVQSKLDKAETHFIAQYACMVPAGYNLTSGGTGGRTVSLATRKKQSAALKGRLFSKETRAKLSIAQKARFAETPVVWTEAARRKLSLRNKGKTPSVACHKAARQSHLGKPTSEYQRMRASETHKGVSKTVEHRAKIGAAQRGVAKSEQAKENMCIAWQRRKLQTNEIAVHDHRRSCA